jgi:hypothetical protein
MLPMGSACRPIRRARLAWDSCSRTCQRSRALLNRREGPGGSSSLGVPAGAAVAGGHAGGARVSWQVGSVAEGVMAELAGCDLMVTHEIEAGGHVLRMCIRNTRRRASLAVPETPCSPAISMTVAAGPEPGALSWHHSRAPCPWQPRHHARGQRCRPASSRVRKHDWLTLDCRGRPS